MSLIKKMAITSHLQIFEPSSFIASASASTSGVGRGIESRDAKIDVLVSNAAAMGPFEGDQGVDSAAFLESVSINIGGALHVAQAFSGYAAADAVVIDVNSNASHLNHETLLAWYSVSKCAVLRLWEALGFANQGLSVFHIHPGVVDTDMNRRAGGIVAIGCEDHVSLPVNFNFWLASMALVGWPFDAKGWKKA